METPQEFFDIIKSIYSLYKHDKELNKKHIHMWLNVAIESIERLKSILSSTNLRVSLKSQYQSALAHLLTLKCKLTNLLEPNQSESIIWNEVASAFEKRIISGVITNIAHIDVHSFLKDAYGLFKLKINQALERLYAIKVYTTLVGEFKIQKADNELVETKYFNTKSADIFSSTTLEEWYKLNVVEGILNKIQEFSERDSGWSIKSIIHLEININKFNPIRGSSYIRLPTQIINKKACVNIKNNDQKCFMWAVLASLHPSKNMDRFNVQLKQYENELKFEGISFPVKPSDVGKFEKQNNISINIYQLKLKSGKYITVPCRLTKLERDRHTDLLIIQDMYVDEDSRIEKPKDDGKITKYHYVWIKNISFLIKSQITKSTKAGIDCKRCSGFFWSKEKFNAHINDCHQLNKCKITLPSQGNNILKFKNFNHKEKVPFVVYADFECLLQPVLGDQSVIQKHKAYSVGFYVSCSFDSKLNAYYSYRQENDHEGVSTPAQWFVGKLRDLALMIDKLHKNPKKMRPLTEEEKKRHESNICHICEKEITDPADKVMDHDHLTSFYRNPAHNSCNLNYNDSRVVPVVFHNFTGYDSHLFIKEIVSGFKGEVSLLPITKEKYISFSKEVYETGGQYSYNKNGKINRQKQRKIHFRFIDSFRFLPSSLDKLASYQEKLPITESIFMQDDKYSRDKVNLLKRKGIFPYEYVESLERLKERELPSRQLFYSHLNDEIVSSDDYAHAKNVWNTFNIQNLGEYSDLYLKNDVLLLADVFSNFRDSCIESYGLDPAHYYTTPGFSWDAMLKCTKVELELVTDIEMLLMIERGLRGGVSQCCNRHSKANNKYMNNFRKDEQVKYISYFDLNNLYGWAMNKPLPQKNFKMIEENELKKITDNMKNKKYYDENGKIGYFLEVSLDYPESLHDDHKDLPFCPEHRAPKQSSQKKLMTTLHNKEKYVMHYVALQQALQHGLILKEIHRGIEFEQSCWLEVYIDKNSEKRAQAKNEFDKLLFKLFNNAVYGKTMENLRKRRDVKLTTHWDGRWGAESYIKSPNFHSSAIFDENLVACEFNKTEVYMDKPIYIGLAVLDLSKTLVYRFHYDFMKSKLGDKVKLLYTDTDSLLYEIKDIDMYEFIKEEIDEFDTSDYPPDNPYKIPLVNKKIVGKMKDECNGMVIEEYIGLRSKLYIIKVQQAADIKKAKGVKTSVVKKTINFDHFKDCLINNTTVIRNQTNIRSRLHHINTEKVTKVALSAADDKRYLIEGETDTLPYGHWRIAHIEKEAGMNVVPMDVGEGIGREVEAAGLPLKRPADTQQSTSSSEPARKKTHIHDSNLKKTA